VGDFSIPEPACRSSYPKEQRSEAMLKDGTVVSVRPIRPEDAPLLVEFFNGLSEASIVFRFLGPLKTLPPEWVNHFTRIDYTQDVALVAVKEIESRERILGVCRIMRRPDSTRGELAIVIDDHWQDKGIGKMLSKRCMSIAKKLGMESIWGIVSARNKKFLALAKQLGFAIQVEPGAGAYRIDMNLIDNSR
jgi:acetyltransferase